MNDDIRNLENEAGRTGHKQVTPVEPENDDDTMYNEDTESSIFDGDDIDDDDFTEGDDDDYGEDEAYR